MRVRFWGVRGSVPWATPASIGYGCNTPCIEVSDERTGAFLVLDAGSGIVGLGESLPDIASIPILLTHYHWDHTQGLPFYRTMLAGDICFLSLMTACLAAAHLMQPGLATQREDASVSRR